MILTVTPNTAIDRTVEVPGFQAGETFQGRMIAESRAGKGINVSRVLALLGGRSFATGFVSKEQAHAFCEDLKADGVQAAFVETNVRARVNTTIIDPGTDRETHIREMGQGVEADDVEALRAVVRGRARPGAWVAGCGSIPAGLGPDAYAEILLEGRAVGARIALDTNGDGLAAAQTVKPDLFKPNLAELREVCGRDVDSRVDALAAARDLANEWGGAVLVTLGAEGALLVADGRSFAMRCVPDAIASTVGAGDALLAGFLLSNMKMGSLSSSLRSAVAAGAASVAERVAGRIDAARYRRMLQSVEVVPLPR
jgi:1-phosphofructokinase